jgi:hypothetical protein
MLKNCRYFSNANAGSCLATAACASLSHCSACDGGVGMTVLSNYLSDDVTR